MRLLQSILPRDNQTKTPQRKSLTHLLGLLLRLAGPISSVKGCHVMPWARSTSSMVMRSHRLQL